MMPLPGWPVMAPNAYDNNILKADTYYDPVQVEGWVDVGTAAGVQSVL